MQPDVSIILPIYNESPLILIPVLNSIIKQDYYNFELIIIDDSNDIKTIELIRDFSASDARIKIYHRKGAFGLASALNYGIEKSIGSYLVRADSDDLLTSSRLSIQKRFLDENLNVDMR